MKVESILSFTEKKAIMSFDQASNRSLSISLYIYISRFHELSVLTQQENKYIHTNTGENVFSTSSPKTNEKKMEKKIQQKE